MMKLTLVINKTYEDDDRLTKMRNEIYPSCVASRVYVPVMGTSGTLQHVPTDAATIKSISSVKGHSLMRLSPSMECLLKMKCLTKYYEKLLVKPEKYMKVMQ